MPAMTPRIFYPVYNYLNTERHITINQVVTFEIKRPQSHRWQCPPQQGKYEAADHQASTFHQLAHTRAVHSYKISSKGFVSFALHLPQSVHG